MKRISSLMIVLIIGAPAACYATDSATRKSNEMFVLPGQESQVQLISIPNARCDLHAPGNTNPSLEVFSNDEGVIRLHAALDFGQLPIDLSLDCSDDAGTTDSRPVRFRPGTPTIATPKRVLLPALSGDPMHLTQKELRAQGYPRRPDGRNAEQMQQWLDALSRPARKVSPHRVTGRARNRQTILNETSNNWSGFVIEPQDGAKLTQVDGGWVVPRVSWAPRTAPWVLSMQYSSVWVGLDNGPGIFQAGTQQNLTQFSGIVLSTYNGWFEVFPAPIQVIPDFTVNPGDHVLFRVYSVNRSGERDDKGEFMGFEANNYASPIQSTAGDVYAKFVTFTGTTAEWVVERQTFVNGQGVAQPLRPLPNYGTVNITSALAYDSTNRRHDLYTTTNILHKLVMLDFDVSDDGALTSAIQRTGRSSMKFTWVDPNIP